MSSLRDRFDTLNALGAVAFSSTTVATDTREVKRRVSRHRAVSGSMGSLTVVVALGVTGALAHGARLAPDPSTMNPADPAPSVSPLRVYDSISDCLVPPDVGDQDFANGHFPEDYLCVVPMLYDAEAYLRADAAAALARLRAAFKEHFDRTLCVAEGYRDYDTQAALHAARGDQVGQPGEHSHGRGTVVDLCGHHIDDPEHYAWHLDHAASYGWTQDADFLPDQPWHWEYSG